MKKLSALLPCLTLIVCVQAAQLPVALHSAGTFTVLAGISHKGVVDLRSHPNRGRVEAPFCGNRKNRGQLGPVEEDLVGLPARQRG